jgi:hypothetical protein
MLTSVLSETVTKTLHVGTWHSSYITTIVPKYVQYLTEKSCIIERVSNTIICCNTYIFKNVSQ